MLLPFLEFDPDPNNNIQHELNDLMLTTEAPVGSFFQSMLGAPDAELDKLTHQALKRRREKSSLTLNQFRDTYELHPYFHEALSVMAQRRENEPFYAYTLKGDFLYAWHPGDLFIQTLHRMPVLRLKEVARIRPMLTTDLF